MDSAVLNFWQLIAIFICAAQLSTKQCTFNADLTDNANNRSWDRINYLSLAVEKSFSFQVLGGGERLCG